MELAHGALSDPASETPLGASNDGFGAMKGHVVFDVVRGLIPEKYGVSLLRMHLQVDLREVRLSALLHFGEVHEHCGHALASAANEGQAIRIASKPVCVRLVFLPVLVTQQIEHFAILDWQERPFSNFLYFSFSKTTKKSLTNVRKLQIVDF